MHALNYGKSAVLYSSSSTQLHKSQRPRAAKKWHRDEAGGLLTSNVWCDQVYQASASIVIIKDNLDADEVANKQPSVC